MCNLIIWKTNRRKGSSLYTCAIRSAAIYGPGEERHFPRILSLAKLGLLPFKIGGENVRTDWVYVDNLVVALLLASMGLLDDIHGKVGHPIASGQAYFISDGAPVNTFEFLKPLFVSMNYGFPRHRIKVSHALILAHFLSIMYTLLYPWLHHRWIPPPMILPAEVYKVGVTHYFSILKAKQELGYEPLVSPCEGMNRTIAYWQDLKRKRVEGPTIYAWLFSTIGMILLICSAFVPYPYMGLFEFSRSPHLFVYRSPVVLRFAAVIATAIHVVEAAYAWFLAKKVDPTNAKGWFWQTFVVGYFSLRFLLKREKEGGGGNGCLNLKEKNCVTE